MIVADTGAIIALVDAGDKHHDVIREIYDAKPHAWILPWAILPEVDYLISRHLGDKAQRAFLGDIANGAFMVEWGEPADLKRAEWLCKQYRSLELGLVDAVVASVAERTRATAIVTLDNRDFGPLKLANAPRLLPRDL